MTQYLLNNSGSLISKIRDNKWNVKGRNGQDFFKDFKNTQPLSSKAPAKRPFWIFSSERKGPIPTFHKVVKEVGIVPISIFPNLKIGTLGDGWSEKVVLTNDLTKPPR